MDAMNTLLLSLLSLIFALAGFPPSHSSATQRATMPENHGLAAAEQKMGQDVQNVLATITRSGSTNARAYKVLINNDGSAAAESGATAFAPSERSQQFPPGTIDTETLRRLLTRIGDVSRIPTGSCAKSVSFGTRTQITYASKTSGDLQCLQQQGSASDQALLQAAADLGRFVQTILGQLKIDDKRVGPNR